ncbi:MAG: RluA family pseudouridine synthase [Oscillospiraceae bacterium]|nr:RluA family pseudouridine synthase [Oscillospiraceae bacterium]
MSEIREYTVEDALSGTRLDKLISDAFEDITRSAAAKLIEEGRVSVNGKKAAKSAKPVSGDVISANIPDPEPLEVTAENIPVDIVYEDDELLVVNKPKGMVVHPAAGNYSGTLVNALMYHCKDRLSSINGVIRPGIVHRIDKLTSGLLIVAKTDKSHLGLAEQIKAHSFTREYQAVICGHFKESEGTIDAPIGRHPVDRKKMCVTEKNSKNAVTHYYTIEEFERYSHIRLRLETGRTHQIRVHTAYMGHPVLGDEVYGKSFKGIEGQCLHAKKIGFIHPATGEYMEFDSELPEYFKDILRRVDR